MGSALGEIRTHTDAEFKSAASALGYESYESGAHGRSRTRTRPHLKRLSLLLDYMGLWRMI